MPNEDDISTLMPLPDCTCGASKGKLWAPTRKSTGPTPDGSSWFVWWIVFEAQTLTMDPLPCPNKTYQLVRWDEKQRGISSALSDPYEGSAVMIKMTRTKRELEAQHHIVIYFTYRCYLLRGYLPGHSPQIVCWTYKWQQSGPCSCNYGVQSSVADGRSTIVQETIGSNASGSSAMSALTRASESTT